MVDLFCTSIALTAFSLLEEALTVSTDEPVSVLVAPASPTSITPPELEDLFKTELLVVSKSTVALSAFKVPPILPVVFETSSDVSLIRCPAIRPALTALASERTSD